MKNILEQDFKLHAGRCTIDVQEHAFALGYEWRAEGKLLQADTPFIFFHHFDKSISFTCDYCVFSGDIETDGYIEITLAEFFALEPKPKEEVTFDHWQPVIVRDNEDGTWIAKHYSHYDNNESIHPHVTNNGYYKHCLPDTPENRKLIGTTNNPEN